MGETKPPKFPIIFIVPATVPTYLSPTSMHAVQEAGIVMSLKKLADAMATTARIGSCNRVAIVMQQAAPVKPITPVRRRVRLTPPIQCCTRGLLHDDGHSIT